MASEEKGESKSYERNENEALEKPGKAAGKKVKKVDLGKKGSFNVRPGALHRALGVPEGKKLGQARINAAMHSSNPTIRKEAISAKGLTSMHHGSK